MNEILHFPRILNWTQNGVERWTLLVRMKWEVKGAVVIAGFI